MKDIKLKQLVKIINEETLTQKEKAKEINRTVRTVKLQTSKGILKPHRLKSNVLYNKLLIK